MSLQTIIKCINFNRYGEYEAYNNGINLYVKYEENNTNNLLDIAPDIIKQAMTILMI